jgi:hypothetical protein
MHKDIVSLWIFERVAQKGAQVAMYNVRHYLPTLP